MPSVVINDALALAARIDDFLVDIADVRGRLPRHADGAGQAPAHSPHRGRAVRAVPGDRGLHRRPRNASGLLDFGDQIRCAVRLVTEHPEIATGLRAQHAGSPCSTSTRTRTTPQRVLLTSIYRDGGGGHRGGRRPAVDLRVPRRARAQHRRVRRPLRAGRATRAHGQPPQRPDDRRAGQPHPGQVCRTRSRRNCGPTTAPPDAVECFWRPATSRRPRRSRPTSPSRSVPGRRGWSRARRAVPHPRR